MLMLENSSYKFIYLIDLVFLNTSLISFLCNRAWDIFSKDWTFYRHLSMLMIFPHTNHKIPGQNAMTLCHHKPLSFLDGC